MRRSAAAWPCAIVFACLSVAACQAPGRRLAGGALQLQSARVLLDDPAGSATPDPCTPDAYPLDATQTCVYLADCRSCRSKCVPVLRGEAAVGAATSGGADGASMATFESLVDDAVCGQIGAAGLLSPMPVKESPDGHSPAGLCPDSAAIGAMQAAWDAATPKARAAALNALLDAANRQGGDVEVRQLPFESPQAMQTWLIDHCQSISSPATAGEPAADRCASKQMSSGLADAAAITAACRRSSTCNEGTCVSSPAAQYAKGNKCVHSPAYFNERCAEAIVASWRLVPDPRALAGALSRAVQDHYAACAPLATPAECEAFNAAQYPASYVAAFNEATGNVPGDGGGGGGGGGTNIGALVGVAIAAAVAAATLAGASVFVHRRWARGHRGPKDASDAYLHSTLACSAPALSTGASLQSSAPLAAYPRTTYYLPPHAVAHGAAAHVPVMDRVLDATTLGPGFLTHPGDATSAGLPAITSLTTSAPEVTARHAALPDTRDFRVALEESLDEIAAAGGAFVGRFDLLGARDRRHGGQGVVQFARGKYDGEEYAIKFFTQPTAFEVEKGLYSRPELRDIMPAINDMSDNADGHVRSPSGWPLPPYVVVERGLAMDEWAARIKPDFPTILQVLCHVAERLRQLHAAGLAHRDLKPGNILWRPRHFSWTLIDFGCAAETGTTTALTFTLRYAPPEVVAALEAGAGSIMADPACDIWALGVIAFEMLTASPAFAPGTSVAQARDQISGREPMPWEAAEARGERLRKLRMLKDTVLQCLARDAAARPTAAELLAAWDRTFDTGNLGKSFRRP